MRATVIWSVWSTRRRILSEGHVDESMWPWHRFRTFACRGWTNCTKRNKRRIFSQSFSQNSGHRKGTKGRMMQNRLTQPGRSHASVPQRASHSHHSPCSPCSPSSASPSPSARMDECRRWIQQQQPAGPMGVERHEDRFEGVACPALDRRSALAAALALCLISRPSDSVAAGGLPLG